MSWIRLSWAFALPALCACNLGEPNPGPPEYAALESDLAAAVNARRDSLHRGGLDFDPALAEIAREHSREMAAGKVPFGHGGITIRVNEARTLGYFSVAENVGMNGYDPGLAPRVVYYAFVHSPSHRRALEGPYAATGVGVARALDGSFYFTQIFAR